MLRAQKFMATWRSRALVGAAAVSAAAAFAVAPSAFASTIYPPAGSCSASPASAQPGGTVTFACEDTTFSAREQVTITVTGEEGADATIGAVHFAISTASGSSRAQPDGALRGIPIALPDNASGTYNIAAVSPSSAGGTAAVSVTDAGTSALPATGLNSASLIPLLVGGGALLVAGAALATVAAMRRSRRRD